MADIQSRMPAHEPNDLERLLVDRQWAGDAEGMAALFEPDAVIDTGDRQVRGKEAILALCTEQAASGKKFQRGEQRPALVAGGLALTSTRLPDGSVTSEVARRQPDGTWLWIIDRYSVL